jgi:hypothetical protein
MTHAGQCSYGPLKLPAIPEAVAELGPEEQLALATQLLAQPGTDQDRLHRQSIAAAIRELLDFVPNAVGSDDVRVRLALAKDPWTTSATLDWLAGDRSWWVRDRVHATVYSRKKWRFIRALA